jgi:hypothetical protein
MIDTESFSSFDVSVSYAEAALGNEEFKQISLDDSVANCIRPPNPFIYQTL